MKQQKFYGYVIAAVSFLIMFINIGATGTIGVFMPAIAATTGMSVGRISIVISAATVVAFLGSFVAGKIIGKLGPKNTLALALLCNVIHFTGYAISGGKLYFMIGAALFSGANLAIGGQGCMSAIINQWFIKKRSSVIGFVFGAAALGSAIFLFISGLLIQSFGWVTAAWILAGLLLVVALPLCLIFIRTPEQMGQKPLGWEEEEKLMAEAAAKNAGGKQLAGVDFKGAIRTPSFWMLMLAMPMLGMMPAAFKSFAPSFWQAGGMDPLVSSQFITVFMIIATLGTWLSGAVADKFGNGVFISYLNIFFVVGMGVVIYSAATLDTPMVVLSMVLVGVSYPLYGSVPATITAGTFGKQSYARIVTTLMGAFYLGLVVMSPLLNVFLSLTGSYVPMFTLMMILGVVSLVLILVAIKISPVSRATAAAKAAEARVNPIKIAE